MTSPATVGAAATPTARRAPSTLQRRLPMLVLGVLSLLAGLWGGLLLLGLHVPTLRTATATEHGPLMALGSSGRSSRSSERSRCAAPGALRHR